MRKGKDPDPETNGSGPGRPINMRIRIPNTGKNRYTILQMIVGGGAISKGAKIPSITSPILEPPLIFHGKYICTLYTNTQTLWDAISQIARYTNCGTCPPAPGHPSCPLTVKKHI
jgi:hypothetical protein